MSVQGSLFTEGQDDPISELASGELQTSAGLISMMQIPGIGPSKSLALAKKFKTLLALKEANPVHLKKLLRGVDIDVKRFTIQEVDCPDDVSVISYFDTNYPAGLRDLDNPPPVLWYRGNIPHTPGIAIVGTRNPSNRGEALAFEAGRISAENDLAVVSGLALGIDSAAHKGSLSSAGINVAVLACDVRTPTPKSNNQLADEILEKGGCLIAEVPLGTITEAGYLVARNRIQAAWAKGLLMAECGIPSGTLHTVRFALQVNRPVAVFDPEILIPSSSASAGNKALINPNGCDSEILGGSKTFMRVIATKKPVADYVLTDQRSTLEFIDRLK